VQYEFILGFVGTTLFELTVYGDGTVVFESNSSTLVKVAGFRISNIGEEKIRELLAEFDRAGFYSMHDYTLDSDSGADFSESVITITRGSTTKRVYHYLGNPKAPETLNQLEKRIVEITNTAQWLGR
jgi:hypothetical protein